MPVRIIVGVNWGDEGKGKMVDYFSRKADYVIRFQGGNNAGHTIENEQGTFKLHLIPSGIFYPSTINVLGPGTVVNFESVINEMQSLRSRGIRIDHNNYKISDRAVICFPFHLLQDEYEEERLGQSMFGSTRQGIAPIYGDRYMKYAIQVGTLNHPEYLKEQIIRCLDLKNRIFTGVYHKPIVNPEATFDWAMRYGEMLKPHICDSLKMLRTAQASGKNIIFEGQLGALRDVCYGIYPYTTSSSTIAAFGAAGSGYLSNEIPVVTGIMKSFSTCVGEGPFVTEIQGELAKQIRETTDEFGALTGRPRRIGHFDAVASRYGVSVSGATEIALTKLDSLSSLPKLKICTHYRIGSGVTDDFPLVPELVRAEPVYIEMPGWDEDISTVREYSNLPRAAQAYVEELEHQIHSRIAYVTVGPHREAIIVR